MRQTLRDSHLTENGGPSVYRFLAVGRRPPRPELVIYVGERPGPADAVLVWGSGRQLFDWQTPPWRHRVRPAATRSSQHRAPPPVPVADGHSRVRFECQSRRPAARHPGQTL